MQKLEKPASRLEVSALRSGIGAWGRAVGSFLFSPMLAIAALPALVACVLGLIELLRISAGRSSRRGLSSALGGLITGGLWLAILTGAVLWSFAAFR